MWTNTQLFKLSRHKSAYLLAVPGNKNNLEKFVVFDILT